MAERHRYRGAATAVCLAVLMFFFASIGVRTVTRQILIKRWGWDNAFTRFVFAYNSMQDDQTDSIHIDWAGLYPFDDTHIAQVGASRSSSLASRLKRFAAKVEDIKYRIGFYALNMLAGQDAIVVASRRYNELIGGDISMTTNDVIFMTNGYYTATCPEIGLELIEEAADGIADFARFLGERDTPFVYINAGSKVCPIDRQMTADDISREMSNENADALLAALDARGVTTIDMRAELLASDRDWYDSYYRTDHHWTTGTSLWAAGVIARYLNVNCGFNIDEALLAPSSYHIDRREEFEMGSAGSKIASTEIRRDDFEIYLPKFSTRVRYTRPTAGIDAVGTFEEVLMNLNALKAVEAYSDQDHLFAPDAYDIFSRTDGVALLSVENLLPIPDSDKRILIIRDSYCNYLIPFLSGGVGRIDAIGNVSFTGSIRRYVEATSPDVVILMPYSHNIEPVDLATHTSALDMR